MAAAAVIAEVACWELLKAARTNMGERIILKNENINSKSDMAKKFDAEGKDFTVLFSTIYLVIWQFRFLITLKNDGI